MPAIVLPYNRDQSFVTQQEYWDCGPASGQLCLNTQGQTVSEGDLILAMGTTTNGTNSIDDVARGLNQYDPEGAYQGFWMPTDPPTRELIDTMRQYIFRTIKMGRRGCVANFVVPPSNYPKAVPKADKSLPGADAPNPAYGPGQIWHYVAILGIDEDDDTALIVDPGFQPPEYWCKITALASYVTPHGIVWSSSAPALTAPAAPAPTTPAAPAPAPVNDSDAQLLATAMWNALPIQRYQELLPAMVDCLKQAECNTENRVAFLLAQVAHESGGLLYQEEIADGSAYEGRADLGNVHPGDGVKYKGRGWIMLTGYRNYEMFSQWAFQKGLCPSPTYFLDNPTEVCNIKYVGLSTSWYWTVAAPGINAMCDANDFVGVTKAVNGGTNGLEDREARLVTCREVAAQLPQLHGCTQTTAPPPPPTVVGTPEDELTMWLPGRTLRDTLTEVIQTPERLDTMLGHSINGASLARVNFELLRRICEHLNIDTTDVR